MDISPVAYKESDFLSVIESVDILKKISADFSSLKSKDAIIAVINQYFEDKSMKLFVQSNLQQSEEGDFKWSFNINNIYDAMNDIREFSIFPSSNNDNNNTYNKPTLVLKGSKSNFVRSFHVPEIEKKFPLFHLVSIKDAGIIIIIIAVNNNNNKVTGCISISLKNQQQKYMIS